MYTKPSFLLLLASLCLLTACTSETKNEVATADNTKNLEEKNKQTAIANVKAFLAGDVDGILKDAIPDMVDYGDGSMPPVKGASNIKEGIKQWRESFSSYQCDNMMAIAEGDYVVIIGEWSATFKNDFGNMKTAGKSFKIKDSDIFRFNAEGKITEHRSIQSSAEMMKQLGVVTE